MNVCGRGPRAARRLYAHVFAGPETPRSSAQKKNGSFPAAATDVFPFPDGFSVPRVPARKKPADARRVPRRDREALLPLLQLMLHRARRCPYGALLDAHCPMPAGVARRLGGGRDAARPAISAHDRFFDRLDETVKETACETTAEIVDLTKEEEDEELPDDKADDAELDFGEEVFFSSETAEDAASDDAERRARKNANDAESDPPSLLASFVPPRAVASFLWAVIRRVAPRETLGGRRSRASLRNFLLRMTSLRRSERCTLHEAMRGARTSEFPWLFGKRLGDRASSSSFEDDEGSKHPSRRGNRQNGRTGPVTSYLARRRRLRRWFRFLLAEFAVPLLRAHFYCTETEANRNRMFFYRKGVWARLTAAHLAATTEDEGRETKTPVPKLLGSVPVDPAAAATVAKKPYARLKKPSARYALQRHLLGFSRLRLLPKHSGLRPVAMLGRPAVASFAPPGGRGGNGKRLSRERRGGDAELRSSEKERPGSGRVSLAFRPVNAGLQSVFDVLRFESKRRPEVMGANVSDYHDVRARLVPFIRRWRARQRRLVRERSREERTEPSDVAARGGTKRRRKKKRDGRRRAAARSPVPRPSSSVRSSSPRTSRARSTASRWRLWSVSPPRWWRRPRTTCAG